MWVVDFSEERNGDCQCQGRSGSSDERDLVGLSFVWYFEGGFPVGQELISILELT